MAVWTVGGPGACPAPWLRWWDKALAWSLLGASLGQHLGGQARGTGCGLTKAGKDRSEMVSWASESGETLGMVARTSEALEMCLGCLSSDIV